MGGGEHGRLLQLLGAFASWDVFEKRLTFNLQGVRRLDARQPTSARTGHSRWRADSVRFVAVMVRA